MEETLQKLSGEVQELKSQRDDDGTQISALE